MRALSANATLLLLLTALFWAGNAVASRLAVGHVPPLLLTTMRWAFVCALMLPLAWEGLRQHAPALRSRPALMLAMGLLGFTAFNTLMYLAAHQTTALNIGLLQGAMPVLILLGAFVVDRTPVRAGQAAGVLVTVLGVAVVVTRGDPTALAALAINGGDALMLVACLLYALYTILLRRRPLVPGLVFFAALTPVALLSSLPLAVAEVALGQSFWPTPQGWLVIAYVTLFPSLLAQILFIRGVELVGPGRAGVFVNMTPIFTALLAVLILGEPFGAHHAAALVLVLGGIALAEWSVGRKAAEAPAPEPVAQEPAVAPAEAGRGR